MWIGTSLQIRAVTSAAKPDGRRLFLDLGTEGGKCAFTLRKSARAKHLRLIVNGSGLTVVAPPALASLRDIEALLEPHKAWILRSLERMKLSSPPNACGSAEALPERILLKALEETWHVELADTPKERMSARDGIIRLPRDFCGGEALAALRRWVLLRARETLPVLLADLAAEHGFRLRRVAVKALKSRWGSCSSKGNINLNARLLFLPPGLVRHVLLHELCHLEEMNHARAFHDCLCRMDPEAGRHAAELRGAWRMVPLWAYR